MKELRRVYHPVSAWEEVRYNMWGRSTNPAADLEVAIDVTGGHELYGSWMIRVIHDWPVSCENALTDGLLNKRAWIGHAAVAYGYQIPENIVRKAWGCLDDDQRRLANAQAQNAIDTWEHNYRKSRGLCENVGEQMLFAWDTGRSPCASSGNPSRSEL